jgi:branched-chain amino acid transport system substrate-binding protein
VGTGQAAAEDTPTFRIGALLPQSGNLQVLGPPTIAGVKLAVQDINAAGGVFGKPVELEIADSGDTSTGKPMASVNQLLANGADAIIGPASSAVAMAVIQRVTQGSDTLMIAPSTTWTEMSRFADNQQFFRTVPTDPFQGAAVAELARKYGAKRLAILANRIRYGQELMKAANQRFRARGGTVVYKGYYDLTVANVNKNIAKLKAKKADAIALVGFEESRDIIKLLRAQGLLPQSPKRPRLYLVDANMFRYKLPPKTLNGVRGVIPGSWASKGFYDRLLASSPGLTNTSFAAEAYDATVLAALAAVKTKNDSGMQMALELTQLSRTGNSCTTFSACVQALGRGEDVNYDGVSGRIEFDGRGDPGAGRIGIYKYGKNNRYVAEQFYEGPTPYVD